MSRARALVGVAAGVAVVAFAACRRANAPEPADDDGSAAPVAVSCAAATALTTPTAFELRGVVAAPPSRDAAVSSTVAGRIVDVRVREGDAVTRGQLLATVDDPSLSPAVAESDAAVSAAGAALATADAARARTHRLVDEGIAPRRDAEDVDARHAAAAAEVAAAAARRDVARSHRDRARVTAPIAGIVVRVLRHAGELVDGTATTPLAEIADLSTLELRVDVPAAQLVHVSVGQSARATLDALPGETIGATIIAVSPAVDPTTGLGVVRAQLDAAPAGVHLVIGLAGILHVDVPRTTPGVAVPIAAVRRAADGTQQVVACNANHVASTVAVTVGPRDGDQIEILRGVAAGQLVVTSHVLGLEDGAPFVVHGEQPAGSAAGRSSGSGARAAP